MVLLTVARRAASGSLATQDWLLATRQAARLAHPHLVHPIESGVEAHQPYLLADRALGDTLAEYLGRQERAPEPTEVVSWMCQALEGMAFAHDAGVTWAELSLEQLLISPQGFVRLAHFPATPWNEPVEASAGFGHRVSGVAAGQTESEVMRRRTQANVLTMGLLLHRLLAGRFPLEEADLRLALGRMAPWGKEAVRLPHDTPHPVPDSLRVIVNRATAADSRQRYLSARTLLGALQSWLDSQSEGRSDPVRVVLGRAQTAGMLPSLPNLPRLHELLAQGQGSHLEALSAPILSDMALSLEVLRRVNARSRAMSGDSDAVLSMRRAVALLGVGGLLECANGMQAWPGPLDEDGAASVQQLMVQAQRSALVARRIMPAGYDADVVHLAACFQSLGRLLLAYHHPNLAEQVRQLMRPAAPSSQEPPGSAGAPGMGEHEAVLSVLGMGLTELGGGVVKSLGLGEELQAMMSPIDASRHPDATRNDADILRAVASAANEAVQAWTHQAMAQQTLALEHICQRYVRIIDIGPLALGEALRDAWLQIRDDGSLARTGGASGTTPKRAS
jgi:non-specific serine/threonine protein kinase